MKELSIEEKAKAYDEAIKRAKEINNEKKAQPFNVMLKIFPELKESEDEESKKWILEYLYDGLRKSDEQFKEQFKCAIAWLEKQGKKSIIIDVDKMVLKYSQTTDGDFGLPVNCQIRAYRQGINDALNLSLGIKKQGEQKSAWSEEDTETLNGIVNYLFTSTDVSSIEGSDKWYDWLKSLKNRVIPKQEWSEEDDNCLSTIIAEFSKCAGKSVSKDEWMRCNDFLNSIRDRVQLKTGWGKEDERIYQSIIDDTVQENQLDSKQINLLKSIKSRKLCVYNPYKAVVESIAKMCDKYKNCMCDEKEAKDFLANVAVKCREAAEYDKNYPQ